MMRDRMERFVILPFPVGCVSQSSVAVCDDRPKKNNILIKTSPKGSPKGEDGESFTAGKAKASTSFLPTFPRTNISAGLQKLVKGFKRVSHLFTVFREQEDEEQEEEMVIGFPTDVKHVAHIGWDGATGVPTAAKGGVPELLSLPSISFRQFERAMAAQADSPPPP